MTQDKQHTYRQTKSKRSHTFDDEGFVVENVADPVTNQSASLPVLCELGPAVCTLVPSPPWYMERVAAYFASIG